MKYIKGCIIIMGLALFGEYCHHLIPFYIPGSIYGLLVMVGLLYFGVVKEEQFEVIAAFLFMIFPIIFIPSATKIVDVFPQIRTQILELSLIVLVSTILSMFVTTVITDKMISVTDQKRENIKK